MSRITLDTKHKQIMRDLRNNKKSLSTYKREYAEGKKRLKELETTPAHELTTNEFEEKYRLNTQLKELKQTIHRIEDNRDEDEYFINTSDLLYQYYEKTNEPIQETDLEIKPTVRAKTKKPSRALLISDFLNQTNMNNMEMGTSPSSFSTPKMDSYFNNSIQEEATMKRGEILDKYLRKVDPTYINYSSPMYTENMDVCPTCHVERTLIRNEGILLCEKCNQAERIMLTSERPNPKEKSNTDNCFFTYKRINHFLEWLSQIQAKQTTEIPEELLEAIRNELKKEKITDYRRLNNTRMREYLKTLGYNNFYEHIPYIIYRITGIKPLNLSRELEEKLCVMFKEIQEPFEKVCPPSRKNFLSYSYVLFKFFELLGLDEYKGKFPLLKSPQKLYEQDIIWKNICKLVRWEYIPSV